MIGLRISLNDAASSEALIGFSQDLEGKGQVFIFESSRRIGNHIKATLESFFVIYSEKEDPIHSLRRDDYVLLERKYDF